MPFYNRNNQIFKYTEELLLVLLLKDDLLCRKKRGVEYILIYDLFKYSIINSLF